MARSEERSGLLFTLLGGGGLLLLLAWGLGFFRTPGAPAPQESGAPPARFGAVSGRVLDALTRAPLVGATVEALHLEGLSDHWILPPDPLAPGAFVVQGLPLDRGFDLAIQAPGHVSRVIEARVPAEGSLALGDLELVPLVVLAGRVVDSRGRPCSDATVEARGALGGPPELARADLHGAFRLGELRPDRYALLATTPRREFTPVELPLDATRGGETTGIELELFQGVAVSGRVIVAIGERPPVEARLGDRPVPLAGDGAFEVERLLAGTHEFGVRSGDAWQVVTLCAPVRELAVDLATIAPRAAPPAASESPPTRVAAPAAATTPLLLRAVAADGAALAGARIETREAGGALLCVRFAAADGECVVHGLATDSVVTLAASHGDRVSFPSAAVVGRDGVTAPLVLLCAEAPEEGCP